MKVCSWAVFFGDINIRTNCGFLRYDDHKRLLFAFITATSTLYVSIIRYCPKFYACVIRNVSLKAHIDQSLNCAQLFLGA